MPDDDSPTKPARTDVATIAGILVFLGGGLTTVLAAITNFGAEGGAIDAARRNHTDALVLAAALAATGLLLGALYTILRKLVLPNAKPRWRKLAGGVLVAGVVAVAAGVVVGVYATAKREPGRPTIAVARTGEDAVRVSVTANGLASENKFDIRVEGYSQEPAAQEGRQPKSRFVLNLLSARFSPEQSGELEWSHVINIAPPLESLSINYLQVIVAKPSERLVCSELTQTRTEPRPQTGVPTCMYTRVPPYSVGPVGPEPTEGG
jgi:hypothetical protein